MTVRVKTSEQPSATLIAIDWGSSNRRAYMVDCQGTVLEMRQDNHGILNIENDAFAAALYPFIAGWRNEENDRLPVLMSGMIGSRQGWIEAPYVSSPASPADLAASVIAVPDTENVWIVPGVCLDPEGERRDVIRGEEVQVIGALDQTGRTSAVLCLPGTHSKWVHAGDGYLLDFATAMTGEVFKVMCEYSILGTLMRHGADHDADAFVYGLDAAAEPGGLLNHMFRLRADGLFGVTSEDQQASYLSGLLIGHEIRDLDKSFSEDSGEVLIVGSNSLVKTYSEALGHMDIPFQTINGHDAAVRGLNAVWASRRETD